MKKYVILSIAVCVLLLSACTAPVKSTAAPEETRQSEIVETTAAETAPAKEIEPVKETEQPEEERWEVLDTPESSCFTVIMYCLSDCELRVCFRESGAWYAYYDFEPEMWIDFKNADSKGGYYNEYIKGCYACDRV